VERAAAKKFAVGFWNFAKKFFRLIVEKSAEARNNITAKKLLADYFKTFSRRPEHWTVSGQCKGVFDDPE